MYVLNQFQSTSMHSLVQLIPYLANIANQGFSDGKTLMLIVSHANNMLMCQLYTTVFLFIQTF